MPRKNTKVVAKSELALPPPEAAPVPTPPPSNGPPIVPPSQQVLERFEQAKEAGVYMVAIWDQVGEHFRFFRLTNNFPLASFPEAVRMLLINLMEQYPALVPELKELFNNTAKLKGEAGGRKSK
jgi:hypothetical protein